MFKPGKIPWIQQPGGQRSIGSQRVGHDWSAQGCVPKWHLLLANSIFPFSLSFFSKFFIIINWFSEFRSFLFAQTVKNPRAMVEICVQTLGREDPLEEGMATHSSVLAWRTSWTEEPGGLQSVRSQRGRQD